MRKSHLVQALLALLLGPFGLFYSSIAAALAMILLAAAVATWTLGIGALLFWPLSIPVGIATVWRHNKRVRLEERRHQELLQAAAGRAVSDPRGAAAR